MKTITKEYNLYTFDELPQEAKDKAREDFNQDNGYPFLADNMAERLHELLEENDIKDENDTSVSGTKPTKVLYSLSYCQGDGAMFEGSFVFKTELEKVNRQWKKYIAYVKHSGHYYHSNSKTVDIRDEEDNEASEGVYKEWETIYQKICKELERYGYTQIEYENSEECFRETSDILEAETRSQEHYQLNKTTTK